MIVTGSDPLHSKITFCSEPTYIAVHGGALSCFDIRIVIDRACEIIFGLELTEHAALRSWVRNSLLPVKYDIPLVLCLLHALFAINCGERHFSFLICDDKIGDRPFFSILNVCRSLPNFEDISLFENLPNERIWELQIGLMLPDQIQKFLLVVIALPR